MTKSCFKTAGKRRNRMEGAENETLNTPCIHFLKFPIIRVYMIYIMQNKIEREKSNR